MARVATSLMLGSFSLWAQPGVVHAHAPFPAPVAVIASGDDVVIGLNVGLVVRPEGASSWGLTCSADSTGDVLGYRTDPSASGRVLALLHDAVALSEDLGCTWQPWPAGGELIDAGFAAGDRIWVLVLDPELQQASIRFWSRSDPGSVSQTAPLPYGLEISNAMVAGATDDQRFWVSGYDATSGSAYLLDIDVDGREGWTQRAVTEGTFELAKLVYASPDSQELVVRLMGSTDERLALTSDGESFSFSPLLGGFLRALFHNGDEGFLVGLRIGDADHLLRLDRDGVPFESEKAPFAMRQIEGSAQRLFALNYELDGSPVLFESPDLGATWSPVIRLLDVRGQHACEPVPSGCAELGCAQLATIGLVDYDACMGTGEQTGEQDAGLSPDQPSGGCSAGARPRRDGALWLSCVVLAGLALHRRRAFS